LNKCQGRVRALGDLGAGGGAEAVAGEQLARRRADALFLVELVLLAQADRAFSSWLEAVAGLS